MKRFLLFLICAICVRAELKSVSCYRVVDGDTFYGTTEDGDTLKVRLYGIDTPEQNQPFGDSATEYVSSVLFNKTVSLEIVDTDKYGRLVANVFISLPQSGEPTEFVTSLHLTRSIVLKGYGWWYEKYAPEDSVLKANESFAREWELGLWSQENPIAPWEWRRGKRSH